MSKLERECDQLSEKMKVLAAEIEAFNKRKIPTLPSAAAQALLKGSLALMGAASKIQLRAARTTAKDIKKHFSAPATR
jgi:hypothetical protein